MLKVIEFFFRHRRICPGIERTGNSISSCRHFRNRRKRHQSLSDHPRQDACPGRCQANKKTSGSRHVVLFVSVHRHFDCRKDAGHGQRFQNGIVALMGNRTAASVNDSASEISDHGKRSDLGREEIRRAFQSVARFPQETRIRELS